MPLTKWSMWKWRRWTSGMRPPPVGVVMPNLVDTRAFAPSGTAVREGYRRRYGIPADAFVLGRIGQPIDPKWSPVIFRAYAAAGNERPDWYLLLAGLPPELRRHARALPASLRSRVVEVPFMYSDEELQGCYAAMDVFLHASAIGESFGLVLAEAMLCERPVITLSTPARDNSQLEVVGHDRGGLVVNDESGMIEAMMRLAEDPHLRARLGRDGAASIRHRYSLDTGVDHLLKISEIALRSRTPAELRSALHEDPDLITEVSTSEIDALLRCSLGNLPIRERILMRAVHTGWLYRLYSRFFVSVLGKT
jgi:glycosyltransferase involved in cell wall biosynthesis